MPKHFGDTECVAYNNQVLANFLQKMIALFRQHALQQTIKQQPAM